MKTTTITSVDEYIASFPVSTQKLLKQVRKTIKATAPKADESISYGMPAYKYLGKPLVYFGGFEKHIGFYATPTGYEAFAKELSQYKQGKGSVQFPIDEKMPLELIQKIVAFRLSETEKKLSASPDKLRAKNSGNGEDAVVNYMNLLQHSLKDELQLLRETILKVSKELKERIKWNAPSYYISEDLFTFNMHDKSTIRLIFHHPTVVQISSPLLQGNYKDRRIIFFSNKKEIIASKTELIRIIKQQIQLSKK